MKNEKLNEDFLDAVRSQNLKLVINLLEVGADPNSTTISSSSALHVAAANKKPQVLKYLLDNGVAFKSLERKDSNGWTPLLNSIRVKKYENAELLVRYGASLKMKTKWGSAIEYLEQMKLDWLPKLEKLAKGKINKPKNQGLKLRKNNTKSQFDLAKAILKSDAKKIANEIKNGFSLSEFNSKRSPLNLAAAQSTPEVLAVLIQAGADVNEWDKDESPLHSAAKNGQEKNVLFLLKKGAEINANGTYGTALLHAVMVENLKGVRVLTSEGANPNLPDDDDGNYPIHFAVLNKNMALVKVLVSAGAKLNVKNKAGQTPADLAKIVKSKAIENFLRKR